MDVGVRGGLVGGTFDGSLYYQCVNIENVTRVGVGQTDL